VLEEFSLSAPEKWRDDVDAFVDEDRGETMENEDDEEAADSVRSRLGLALPDEGFGRLETGVLFRSWGDLPVGNPMFEATAVSIFSRDRYIIWVSLSL
jgi:hypothetical protein